MCYSTLVESDLDKLKLDFGLETVEEVLDEFKRRMAAHPKIYKFPGSGRIYPTMYSPVIISDGAARSLEFMRYSAFPPSYIRGKRLDTFNARRDSLEKPFWSEGFKKRHCVVVLKGFYEWVKVKDVIGAGRLSLEEVRAEFKKQSEARRKKIEASGKPYSPTKTELTDPLFRQIVIEFKPEHTPYVIVPGIYTENKETGDKGYAVITDDPYPEVAAAGHHRTPVNLPESAIDDWLSPAGKTSKALLDLLSVKPAAQFYTYHLDAAA